MPGEDPLARNAALALGAARAGLGLGVLFFTRPTLKAMQFGEPDATARSIAKLLGGRDLTLGLATLAARNSPGTLRQLTLTATLLDAADAVALSPGVPRPSLPPRSARRRPHGRRSSPCRRLDLATTHPLSRSGAPESHDQRRTFTILG